LVSPVSKEAAMAARRLELYRFGGMTLDLARGLLRNGSGDVRLRPKSFDLLIYFVTNAGRVLSKDELLQAVWPGVFVTEDSLVQCVKEIRRAVGDGEQVLIKTIPGRGYIFDLAVTVVEPAGTAPTESRLRPGRLDGSVPSIAALDDGPPLRQSERRSSAGLSRGCYHGRTYDQSLAQAYAD
jgi:DNA-binding winged helix-turn-helix (wHTH) protein